MKIINTLVILLIAAFFAKESFAAQSVPQYFCTGANSRYYGHLINLIGSIHKTCFDDLTEIMVFNLGLTAEEVNTVKSMEKVQVYEIEKTHPELLNFFKIPNGHLILGWYAWKPVAIKQALEKYPYVLWIDAGSTLLKPVDHLFKYIDNNGYFLSTIGDNPINGRCVHDVQWGLTRYVRNKFNLDSAENKWILQKEFIMANLVGVARKGQCEFLNDWYELTRDLKNFEDDGSAPNGWGTARHDQTLLSVLAYLKKLTVFQQDYSQRDASYDSSILVDGVKHPLYITHSGSHVCDKTFIYNSRGDLRNINHYRQFIRYRK